MPIISTIETLNRSPLQGMMASAMLPHDTMPRTTLEAAPDSAMPKKASFPRSARLLRHADFERVYKQGRRHFSATMTVFYCARPTGDAAPTTLPQGLRVGFTVSRALGGAVDRNRMKRRLREAVRLSHPPLNISVDVVINPKKSLLTADFPVIVNEVTRAFAVIEQKLSRG